MDNDSISNNYRCEFIIRLRLARRPFAWNIAAPRDNTGAASIVFCLLYTEIFLRGISEVRLELFFFPCSRAQILHKFLIDILDIAFSDV